MNGIVSAGEEELMCLRGSVEKEDNILTMITIVQSIKCTRLCLCVREHDVHIYIYNKLNLE